MSAFQLDSIAAQGETRENAQQSAFARCGRVNSITDRLPMHGSAQPDETFPPPDQAVADRNSSEVERVEGVERALQGPDLDAALQLLVERARYITGATGAALALLEGEEMVCRASAGACAPAVGARLQVRSGLTGESVSRKQLLRCDNAENDPRVNIETCRELGIASIVVLPLLTQAGEVRGLFELFSDHPYAFEERDLVALERMADLTRTALDLTPKKEISLVVPARTAPAAAAPPEAEVIEPKAVATPAPIPEPVAAAEPVPNVAAAVEVMSSAPLVATPQPELVTPPVPEAMLRVQKCSSCGFPVSEGRTLCVDCEEKQYKQPAAKTELMPSEFVPAFLASAQPKEESWLANHVNVLAILVLILSIIVAIVVFR